MRAINPTLLQARTLAEKSVVAMLLLSLMLVFQPIGATAATLKREKELGAIYESKIVAFWNKHGQRRDFIGVGGARIAAMTFPHPLAKDGVVISSGYGESFLKYREVVYDLWLAGYQVYVLDHRGQGLSQRFLGPRPTQQGDPKALKRLHDLGYIEDFDDFVEDLKTFVDKEAKPNNNRLFLLAHSMGGAIASLYLERFPEDFAAAVLSSPMHQPNLRPIPNAACWLLKLGPSKSYVWGHGPHVARYDFNADRDLTSSRIRYEILKRSELLRQPEAQLGGPSFQWAYESCVAANNSVENAAKIKVDVLLFQAENDRLVIARGQQKFCGTMNASRSGSCQLKIVKGARHELLIESDAHRAFVFEEMFAFFRSRGL
jgi:lysophospholipase